MGDLYAAPRKDQTICEMHRRMYRIIVARDPHDEELLSLLRKAFDMGKKMGNRLKYHKNQHGDDWWALHRADGGEITDVSEGD